jgi:predicted transposase/invertase (TIGR01784 family)
MNENNTNVPQLKMLQPKVDIVFKLLFGDKRNIEILIAFLKSVLNLSEDEYEKITLEDTHLKRESEDDKLGIVDVKLTTKTGKIIHIEIQVLEQKDMPERVTYYNAKILFTQLKSGQHNDKLQKTISIAIAADFDIVKDSPKYHHKFQLNDIDSGVKFTDLIEINTLELQKIPEHSDDTEKYNWLKFLKAEEEAEFDMLAEKSPAIKQAVVELKRLSQDEEAQLRYEARVKAIRDERSRMKAAEEKGRMQEKIEIAINALEIGISLENISKLTGLSIQEIEELK